MTVYIACSLRKPIFYNFCAEHEHTAVLANLGAAINDKLTAATFLATNSKGDTYFLWKVFVFDFRVFF